MVRLGAAYVPQGNVVFPDLTVLENIRLRGSVSPNGGATEAVVDEVLRIAHRVYVLRGGRIAFDGTPEELQDGDRLGQVFL